jgi:hypothetical protein
MVIANKTNPIRITVLHMTPPFVLWGFTPVSTDGLVKSLTA